MRRRVRVEVNRIRDVRIGERIVRGEIDDECVELGVQANEAVGGIDVDDAARARVHSPAGLDIGSEAPEEIALAIVSEVAAVLSNRVGGFLRERRSDSHTITTTVSGEAA